VAPNPGKDCFGVTPKPARETRALPLAIALAADELLDAAVRLVVRHLDGRML